MFAEIEKEQGSDEKISDTDLLQSNIKYGKNRRDIQICGEIVVISHKIVHPQVTTNSLIFSTWGNFWSRVRARGAEMQPR